MTEDPKQQRRRGHVPDLPDVIDERAAEAGRQRRRGHLAERSGYGMGTTSTGAGSGGPGSGTSPASGDAYHKFWASSSANEGLAAGHLVDGARVAFELEDTDGNKVNPVEGSEIVTYNGQYQYEGSGRGYQVSGNTITFEFTPAAGEIGGQCVIGELTV